MDFSNLNGGLSITPGLRLPGSTPGAHARESGASGAGQLQGQVAKQTVERVVTTMQAFTQSISRNLNFSLDDSTGRVVVKVTDASSGEVIRQIPSEEALRLAERLEEARSLLFKAQA